MFNFLSYDFKNVKIKLVKNNSFKFLIQKIKKKKKILLTKFSFFNFFGILKNKFDFNLFFSFSKSITLTLIKNLKQNYIGLSQGFCVELLAVGVGYRFERLQKKINIVVLNLGYAHYNYYFLPLKLAFRFHKNYLFLFGLNLLLLKRAALQIKSYRLPEPYKGKGIRYFSEIIEIKEGKKKK